MPSTADTSRFCSSLASDRRETAVVISDDEFVATFGFLKVKTPLANVDDATSRVTIAGGPQLARAPPMSMTV